VYILCSIENNLHFHMTWLYVTILNKDTVTYYMTLPVFANETDEDNENVRFQLQFPRLGSAQFLLKYTSTYCILYHHSYKGMAVVNNEKLDHGNKV
jgi:hypothetical protein